MCQTAQMNARALNDNTIIPGDKLPAPGSDWGPARAKVGEAVTMRPAEFVFTPVHAPRRVGRRAQHALSMGGRRLTRIMWDIHRTYRTRRSLYARYHCEMGIVSVRTRMLVEHIDNHDSTSTNTAMGQHRIPQLRLRLQTHGEDICYSQKPANTLGCRVCGVLSQLVVYAVMLI